MQSLALWVTIFQLTLLSLLCQSWPLSHHCRVKKHFLLRSEGLLEVVSPVFLKVVLTRGGEAQDFAFTYFFSLL